MEENTILDSTAEKRAKYGFISGIVGVIANLFLSISKIVIGLFTASLSIMADGFNNLSDMASSIVSIIGFKISRKPADKEHPFGHARSEYIAGLVIAFIILFLGAMLCFESVKKIIAGEGQEFSIIAIIILGASILIKLSLGFFNLRLAKKIESPTIRAVATDSFNDCIATSAVLISLIISHFAGVNLDGYMGILVAIIIFIAGIKTLKEMLSPLMGENIAESKKEEIENSINAYDGVLGVHDLIVHSYGKTYFASAHVEMDASINPLESHDVIDNIERDFMKRGLKLVLHYDPVEKGNERVEQYKQMVKDIVSEINPNYKIHDFRAVFGPSHKNLIFDLVLPFDKKIDENKVVSTICSKITDIDPTLFAVIDVDREF